MLRSVNAIAGYQLAAQDGKIGSCKDFLFDDELWTLRYMVADTGGWLSGRRVLISPNFLGTPDWESKSFPVELKKKQIEAAPELDSDAPISRQFEMQYYSYYSMPYYWQGGVAVGAAPSPTAIATVSPEEAAEQREEIKGCHLRSTSEVVNYRIHATDGDIGHVEDLLVEVDNWRIRYMVVDTKNWLPGRKVIISPDWITDVSWSSSSVSVDVPKEHVKDSPEYDPHLPINRDYEERLYDFHGRPVYW